MKEKGHKKQGKADEKENGGVQQFINIINHIRQGDSSRAGERKMEGQSFWYAPHRKDALTVAIRAHRLLNWKSAFRTYPSGIFSGRHLEPQFSDGISGADGPISPKCSNLNRPKMGTNPGIYTVCGLLL